MNYSKQPNCFSQISHIFDGVVTTVRTTHRKEKKSKENGRRNESWRASSQKTLWTK